ncbi:carboxylating nicotinate-nucleotide diphosphorylase [Sphingobacterium spiritivorum]|uniref:Probable nicotinate-nucleotide pyrophosphorylase [carboxylating] n=1 Tax=Sphingobacterium spiritivorum ATCC 33861 TaxID=525373 RepID=D7VMD9_SPHSI|nr:carboxylating nicotinate-nucleotide diphosphorylase [Sphingobacterium spiritivorum]EFK58144.1 nicotinate-nucleotide diphosphorylase (carboxylating) [Sphingobacterium spiritivorum ATCC 33861]QQT34599.1 carboxylating nicotinate-nucleotide diphosphorylase [Sphingobacterium spiritivorum]WQD35480.1 carboxylating nicotinate-nucleotide diphosphorylase [Sphingobacterium spiritivorum]SUJ00507.1 Probable nicotinate-nucleotide pyrophosphorylase [carboxylating] [Sphingobacterium spiritivorum]
MDKEFVEKLAVFVREALQEDVGDGDHTTLSTIPAEQQGEAKLLVKEDGILAGVEVARKLIEIADPGLKIKTLLTDGTAVKAGDIAFYLEGDIHSILKVERLVLNVMQRMSGIATRTHEYVSVLEGTKTKVLDTRKTTPLLRFLEKEAVKIGGGVNHRFGLYDMILIKDNHVDYAGGITKALTSAENYRQQLGKEIQIEIEVRNLKELDEVLAFGSVDRVMLDNFTPQQVKEAVDIIDGRLVTEASGGITIDTIRAYAEAGVDYISVGALTHSVKSLDLSLKAKLI